MLILASDDDFAWLLGEQSAKRALHAAPGGVDEPFVLGHIRTMNARAHAAGCDAHWMVVAGDEVVGLIGFKDAPRDGRVEIGYGVAASRRQLGYATRAVAAVVALAPAFGVTHIDAETAIGNIPSQRALERNGFAKIGEREDAEDGMLILWERPL